MGKEYKIFNIVIAVEIISAVLPILFTEDATVIFGYYFIWTILVFVTNIVSSIIIYIKKQPLYVRHITILLAIVILPFAVFIAMIFNLH